VLAGAAAVLTGGALLSPAAQDGLHAVYVPVAVIVGALLLRKRSPAQRASGGSGALRPLTTPAEDATASAVFNR
jgi:hypothetical protein